MTEFIETTSCVHGELAISLLFIGEEYKFVTSWVHLKRKNALDEIVAGRTHRNYNAHADIDIHASWYSSWVEFNDWGCCSFNIVMLLYTSHVKYCIIIMQYYHVAID